MQRARRYRIVGLALGAGVAAFIALTACSNNSEGERCELGNGNADCADGLVCTPRARLAAQVNTASDRCCPPDLATATAVACLQPQAGFGADSAPPEETGPAPDATVDAAETSAPVEAGPDVVDAAEGGG